MKRLDFLVIVVLLLLFHSKAVSAQETCLWMAGANFCLGMSKEEIANKSLKRYDLLPFSEYDGNFLISEKDKKKLIGNITFKNNKLIFASKGWGKFSSNESIDLGNALLSLIQNINASGRKIATITAEAEIREPGFKSDEIKIIFDKKTISISVTESSQYGNAVYIKETIK